MSDLQLSSATRALLEVARADAPTTVARAKIWSGVAGAAGVAAGAGTLAVASPSVMHSVAAAATTSSVKFVAVGALFGSAVTVGLALAIIRVVPGVGVPSTMQDPAHIITTHVAVDPSPAIPLALDLMRPLSPTGVGDPQVFPRTDAPAGAVSPLAATAAAIARTSVGPSKPKTSSGRGQEASAHVATSSDESRHPAAGGRSRPVHVAEEDSLMREAALVAEARGAIVRGDAQGALSALHTASRLGSHDLEPEELSLESHALRMLGREADAAAVDSKLKIRFPDHALAR